MDDAKLFDSIMLRCIILDGHLIWTGYLHLGKTPTFAYSHKKTRHLVTIRKYLYERYYKCQLQPSEGTVPACGDKQCVLPSHTRVKMPSAKRWKSMGDQTYRRAEG